MTKSFRSIGWSVFLIIGSIGLLIGYRASGQDAAGPALDYSDLENQKFELDKAVYLGAGGCARCHTEPRPSDDVSFVKLNEYTTWKGKVSCSTMLFP